MKNDVAHKMLLTELNKYYDYFLHGIESEYWDESIYTNGVTDGEICPYCGTEYSRSDKSIRTYHNTIHGLVRKFQVSEHIFNSSETAKEAFNIAEAYINTSDSIKDFENVDHAIDVYILAKYSRYVTGLIELGLTSHMQSWRTYSNEVVSCSPLSFPESHWESIKKRYGVSEFSFNLEKYYEICGGGTNKDNVISEDSLSELIKEIQEVV